MTVCREEDDKSVLLAAKLPRKVSCGRLGLLF
jgi:hypothetical protein